MSLVPVITPAERSHLGTASAVFALLVLATAILMIPLLAFGQTVDPGTDPSSFLLQVVAAIQGGNWRALAVLAAIGLTWAAKRYGAKVWPFLGTARGGAALALFLGVVGTLVPALAGGAAITPKLCIDAVLFGLTSIGGWVGVRRILFGDVSQAVAAEAGKTVIPLGQGTTAQQLGAELDKPVK